jgi:integrase
VAAGRKPTTVVNILGVAKALLVFAHGHSLTRYNPRSKADADRLTFKLHGVGAGHTSPRDAITRATFLQLREYVPAGQWVVFLTMVTIGARIGEMAGLRCGDVDLNGVHPTITITTQIQGTDRLDWTKGDAGGRRPKAARALPITAELAAMLAPLIEGRSMDAPLFVHTSPRSKRLRSGGFWSPNSWRLQVFDTTIAKARAAGVILPATFVPHSLRHSMATWLSEKLTPQQLMLRMRHANIGMTMRYFHDNAAGRAIEHAAVENMLTLAA